MADKHYRIPNPHYREGAYFQRGDVVTIPADEKPGKGWVEVDAEGFPLERPKSAAPATPPPAKDDGKTPPAPKKVLG